MTGPSRPDTAIALLRRSRRGRRRRYLGESGAALVEFALILPVFALMLFGMVQFGLAFTGWDQLRNAVQTAARLAANDTAITPGSDCGQVDPGSNMVCQVAFLIGTPLDTNPVPVGPLSIPSSYNCTLTANASPSGSPPPSCTSTDSNSAYAWLDGYFIFEGGHWLQVVGNNAPTSGQISDDQAFQDSVSQDEWACAPAPSGITCTVSAPSGQSNGALGSDDVTILQSNQLVEVCAQRRVTSFTAFPALQDIRFSTSSTFYLQSNLTGCTAAQPCDQSGGMTCG